MSMGFLTKGTSRVEVIRSVKNLSKEDVKTILRLGEELDTWHNAEMLDGDKDLNDYSNVSIDDYLPEGGVLAVSRIGRKLAGYIRITLASSNHRGKGIGRNLLEYAIGNILDMDRPITLGASITNAAAIKLYYSVGFNAFSISMKLDRTKYKL